MDGNFVLGTAKNVELLNWLDAEEDAVIEEAGEEVEASKELGEGDESVQAPREPEIGIVAPIDMHLPNPFLCCLIITTLNVCLVYFLYWYFPFLVAMKSPFNEMFCWLNF